jgi:hypothetical protein
LRPGQKQKLEREGREGFAKDAKKPNLVGPEGSATLSKDVTLAPNQTKAFCLFATFADLRVLRGVLLPLPLLTPSAGTRRKFARQGCEKPPAPESAISADPL